MGKKKLGPVAEVAAGLVRSHHDDEVEAAYLEKQMGKQRFEVVALLKELEAAGLGRFIAGRHGYPTRFAKAMAAENLSGSELMETNGEVHILVLNRQAPFKVTLPADISRSEADKIMRWVDALPDA